MVNPPAHPAAMHAPMPQFYVLRDQRRIERVPRPLHLSPPHESILAIIFSVNNWAGVRARDILKDTMTIDDAYDMVFKHHGWWSIVVNLEWPGFQIDSFYNPMDARINVCPGGQYMTRAHLAKEVYYLMFNFHKNACRRAIAPGWEKWALTTGPEGIRVPDIVLLSIHHYQNVWIPELYVIE